MKPYFSIIVPVYNVEPYLRECLDSVLAQTFTDWEAICVDDGSTDGSGAILDEYAAKDKRFRVFHKKNAGAAHTRQFAIDLSKGKYVTFVDSDDWVESIYLMNLYNALGVDTIEMVWGDYYLESGDETRLVCDTSEEDAYVLMSEILKREKMGSLWGKAFNRQKILSSGASFGIGRCSIMEDNYFLYGFLLSNPSIRHINSPTYHYRHRDGSLSNKGECVEWWKQVVEANNAIYNFLHGRFDERVLRYRMGMFKTWLFWAKSVPDEMFYQFNPQIRWVQPWGKVGLVQRILLFVSTFHLRWLVRFCKRIAKGG